jgi:putative oxygen-independent coproporphyrinogen III oxidase
MSESGARHLYVHLPFCAQRCGYCDFVTLVGRSDQHGSYVDALLAELELERPLLASVVETVFVGGGTPTFTEPDAFARLLVGLPNAREVTVEANPETVTPTLAARLRVNGVNRVSLGAQSFKRHLLLVLERVVQPDTVRRAFYDLRDAGFDNISLDLIYGIPGQSTADLEADIDAALALGPEHLSCYELEAKPGTRFTHRHGAELARQADAMESYFELVVDRLTSAGYRWYETANFCRGAYEAGGRDLRAQHNLAYWCGRDYLGVGIGAVSTIDNLRWRNTPRLHEYVRALGRGARPPRETEALDTRIRQTERVMLGLRLDERLPLQGLEETIDVEALSRIVRMGLAEADDAHGVGLTKRGRLLGGGVTAEILA